MQPTSLFSFPASPVFLRRLVILLLSSTLVLFLAGAALAQIDNPRPIVADAFSAGAWEPSELPDVAVVLSDVEADDPVLETRVIPALRQIRGVTAVIGEVAPSGRLALHVSLSSDVSDSVLPEIQRTVETGLPEAQFVIGGRAVADRDLLDRLNRGLIIAVVPVVVLLTVLVAAGLGVRFGLAAGGTVGLSALLGGLVGSSVAGNFDGSLATTAVPAVLVAVLVSSVLSFRLLEWFKQPRPGDHAEAIRDSVKHLLPEAALLFGGLIVTAIVLQLVGGSTPTAVVAVGGVFASLVTFGALPALLATMGAVPDDDDNKLFKLNTPDGRDFPMAVLAGFACFLLGLGLFALRVPDSTLLDESALPQGVSSRRASQQMVELGGDPSSAVLAEIALTDDPDAPVDERAVADWGAAVSDLPSVGWVETATGRYAGGVLVSAPVSGTNFTSETSTMAIVTPIVTPRSDGAIELIATLGTMSSEILTTDVVLSGSSVDAADAVGGGTLRLWLLVGLLSITGALAVLLLVNDLVLAGLAFGLRLIGTLGLLGVYHLLAGDVGVVELQVAALVFSVGVGLFEIGFLRRIRDDVASSVESMRVETDMVHMAFRREGRAAMLGLAVTALCGLGLLASDLTVARQLGLAVAAGVVIELLIGTWMLRPAMLGERAVSLGFQGSTFDLEGLRDLNRRPPSGARVLGSSLAERRAAEPVPEAWLPKLLGLIRDSLFEPSAPRTAPPTLPVDGQRMTVGPDVPLVAQVTIAPPPPRGDMLAPPASRDSYVSDTEFGAGATATNEPPTIVVRSREADAGLVEAKTPEADPVVSIDVPATLEEHPAGAPRTVSVRGGDSSGDPEWRRIVANLLRQEFEFQAEPAKAELETVFVDDTPLFGELLEHNKRLRSSGLQVRGEGPILRKVTLVNSGSPVTLAITVDHPARQLLDQSGRLLGTRPAERREGMLWLIQDPSGRYRIAEAVDLGTANPDQSEVAPSREGADDEALPLP